MLAIRWSKMRNFIWPTSKSAIVVQFSAAAAANSVRITQSNTSHRLPGIARPFFMGGKFMAGVGDRLPDGPISSLLPPLQPTHLQHTHTHSQPPPFVVHCRSWDWVEFGSWVGGAAWQIARHLTAASIQRQFRLIFLYFHFAFFFLCHCEFASATAPPLHFGYNANGASKTRLLCFDRDRWFEDEVMNYRTLTLLAARWYNPKLLISVRALSII